MTQKEELAKIVGAENVFDAPKTLEEYARDESFVRPIRPRYVVKPKGGEMPDKIYEEVQEIVKWANDTGTPLIPVSSGGPHFRGDTVPGAGGAVVVDLSRMNRAIRVDRANRSAMIETGVTFAELIPALKKEGLKPYLPLVPRRSKSVMGSMLEREPITMPKHQWDIQDPLLCLEVIFGTGDMFRTGDASGPGTITEQWKAGRAQLRSMAGQLDLQRVIQGAQGTMGIATWATLKCREIPEVKKSFLVPSDELNPLIDLSYRLFKILLGDECLILNNQNLASILAHDADDLIALRESLPPWILFFGIEGNGVLPEEKVAYQEEGFMDAAQFFGLYPKSAVAGVTADHLAEVLSQPSGEPYWKLKLKGGNDDIFFVTTLDKTPEFIKAVYAQAESSQYPPADIGIYLQPMVQGTSCHCEFNLSYHPANKAEVDKVKRLVTEKTGALANMGGFFSRPYGSWSDMAYRRDGETTAALRKVKGIFDPNNIMNPGKLCF